jgi:phage-related protein
MVTKQPTITQKVRGIVEGTSTGYTNKNLVHVCDVTGPLVYGIAYVSFQVGELIQTLRTTLRNAWLAVSNSPFGDAVRGFIDTIKSGIELIQKFIAKVQEVAQVIQDYIKQLTDLLLYIATLPARIAQSLIQCVNDAIAELKLTEAQKKVLEESTAKATAETQTKEKEDAATNTNEVVNDNYDRELT